METRQAAAERSVARCILFAYHEMGYACLAALLEMGATVAAVFTHDDDPGEEIWWHSCAELARRNSIPLFSPHKIDREWKVRIAEMRPDIIYSFFYRRLLSDDVLQLAPLGAFNLHASLLPRYRGRAPVNWVLVNGEPETGVTLHHMVVEADAGDIVGQRAVAIDDSDTALTLYRKLVPLGAELLREFHPRIVAGTAPRVAQDRSQASYFGRRRPEDGRIDWRWPARRIFNLVRAVTHPYPGAFCFHNGRKLFIWEARIAQERGRVGDAGVLLGKNADGGIEVAAGEGSIVVVRAQFEGGIEDNAERVLRSANSGPGCRHGEPQITAAGTERNVSGHLE